MQVLKNYVLFIFFFLGIGIVNLSAQVTEVQFQMKFDTAHCWYDCYLIVKAGSAVTPQQRAQFNANYSLVLPTGISYNIDSLYNPTRSDNGQPMNWLMNEQVISPAAQPQNDFHTVIPELSPIAYYDHLNEGDTIKLFSFSVSSLPVCAEGVRLFENGVDPPSHAPGMNSSDFSQGFTVGGFVQQYVSNVIQENPPGPDQDAELGCVDGIFIDLNPIASDCMEPLIFNWDGPGISGTYTDEDLDLPGRDPLNEGMYSVTVTDALGCIDTFEFVVENKPNGGGDLTTCSGTTATLEGSDPLTGTWIAVSTNNPGASLGATNSGDADVTFDASANGIYQFYYDVMGCGDTINVTVNSGATIPTVTGDAEICEGEDINLSTPFVAGATYSWTSTSNNGFTSSDREPTIMNATIDDDGEYTVNVTANGCVSGDGTFDVTVNPLPIADPSNNGPLCEGEDLELYAATVAGATYQWTGPNAFNTQNPTISNITTADAGIYTLVVTLGSCVSAPVTTEVVINAKPSAPTVDNNGPLCVGDDLNLTSTSVTNATYQWTSLGGNGFSSGMQNPTINNVTTLDDGEYQLIVIVDNCDSDPVTTDVVINENPTAPNVSNNGPICEGETLEITADFVAGAAYDWTPNSISGQNPTITNATVSDGGTYTLNITVDGCESMPASTLAVVNEQPADPIAGNNGPLCEGEDLNLTASNVTGATYMWSGPGGYTSNQQNPTITSVTTSDAGTYEVKAIIGDCESDLVTTEVVINTKPAPPIVGNNGPLCEGDLLELTASFIAGASYAWTGPDGFMSNQQNPTIAGVTSVKGGDYEVIVTLFGCDSDPVSTTVAIKPQPPVITVDHDSPYCVGEEITLTPTSVSGADYMWTLPDFSTSTDEVLTIPNAGFANQGNYILKVTLDGCESPQVFTNITVIGKPTADAGSFGPYCINDDKELLVGNPTGGDYSGVGITANEFIPIDAGIGTHTITYTVTAGNGCSDSATTEIEVKDLPTVDAGSFGPYCINDSDVTLAGNPAGGNYTGNGASGSIFSPSGAGAGTHTVTYSYTDGDGCENTATVDIVVNDLPTVDAGTYAALCVDAGTITLAGTPASGTFSGDGVSGTEFSPMTAGAGNHTILYEYTDGNGCTNSATVDIVVNELPTVDAGTYTALCVDAGTITLAGTPASGTFSGDGVSGTEFSPMTAGVGTHTITYEYTDGNGCTNTATVDIVVNELPLVDAGTYAALCVDAANITLAGTPASGTFSGDGVSGTEFSPMTAGVGTHTIMYEYTDGNGCTNNATVDIVVNELPLVDAGTYTALCVDAGTITLAGTPASGTFSGDGVSGTEFSPMTAGAGTHTITYEFTDGNGCTNSATVDIVVNELPTVDAGTYTALCVDAGTITLAGTPASGTFSGDGVSGTEFSPMTAGVGTHTITYEYTDGNGCTNTATVDIVVNELPLVDAGTYAALCVDAANITLAGTPASGTFSGDGVSGTEFSPMTAGAGTHTILYEYTDGNGCTNTATVDIVVNELPLVDAGTYAALCVDAGTITLAGTPASGMFSGDGVSGTEFSPMTAGAGTHTITYEYTDGNGCTNSATVDIVVNELPTVDAGTYTALCVDAGTITLAGTPASGTFSGDGVSGTEFSPMTAGVGTHTITYEYTDGNGCTNTATVDIVVNELPLVDAGTYAALCVDAANITLAGTPASGTFSGDGVSGTEFSPMTAGVGTHTIMYEYTDGNGCTNNATVDIVVNELPTVDAGTYTALCVDAGTITLAGTPASGTFSGDGVSGTEFSPMTAGAGTHTITYEYTDGNGCTNSATVDIVVNDLPTVDAGTYAALCIDAGSITLSGTPANGTFSGSGINGSDFDPSVAGVGTHTITYEFTDGNGCANSATVDIVVNDLPTVDAGTYAALCVDAGSITLSVTPANGTFSGSGINGSDFDPSVAGVGTHTITYEFTDGNGCANSATVDIVVNDLPTVDAGTYAALCVDAGTITLAGTPASGTFSGNGVSGTEFSPMTAGAGTHTIMYEYTDGNGCTNTSLVDIVVNELPLVDAGTYAALCLDAGNINLSGTPFGGTFSGTGVIGDQFDPEVAGVGTHTITYEYTDGNGCTNSATVDIVVNDLPIVDAGTYAAVCIDAVEFDLTGTPSSGTFSGPGVDNNKFNPNNAGAGIHTIDYEFTDNNGCINTAQTNITVNPLPIVIAGSYAPLCEGSDPINLQGNPLSGTFSGPGVNGNTFDPDFAGVGTHTIEYEYTDNQGCTNTASTFIEVKELPTVDAGTYADLCLDAGKITLSGTPNGGVLLVLEQVQENLIQLLQV